VKRPTFSGTVASNRRAIDVTTPASIAAATAIGLKVEPSSYTLWVTLLRGGMPVIALGLNAGSDTIAITSPVLTSRITPAAPCAWNAVIALPSSLSSAACTRESIDSATGSRRRAGSVSRASSAFSIPATPWPS